MASLNEVRMIGRLTRDPELRSTPSGQSVCSFGFAINHKFKGQDGEGKEETTFVEITCWAKLAENVAKYMAKGKQVFIGGRLKLDTWKNNEGETRTKLHVVAMNVQFLDKVQARGDGEGKKWSPDTPSGESESNWGKEAGKPFTAKANNYSFEQGVSESDPGDPPF